MNDNTRSDPLAPAVGAQVERPVGRLEPEREATPLGVHWLGDRPYMLTSDAPPQTKAPTKAAYVRSQAQTRKHHCHWPGCEKQVPPAMWGCKGHWFALPAVLRARIWATYKPGQEVNGTPSAAYIEAAKAVQAWIAERSETHNDAGKPRRSASA